MFEVHRNLQVAKSIEINVTIEDGIQHHNISTPIQNPYTHEYPYTQEYPTQQSTPIQNPYTQQTRRIPQPSDEFVPSSSQLHTYTQPRHTSQPRHIPQPFDEYAPSSSQPPMYTEPSSQFEDVPDIQHEEEVGDESEEDDELLNLLEGVEDDEDDEDDEDGDVWANILHPSQGQQEATHIR
jgi:hypothetical protein